MDGALSAADYGSSQGSSDPDDARSQRWYVSPPRSGPDGFGYQAVAIYFADRTRPQEACDVQVDLYGTLWRIQVEAEWGSFFRLRDSILPEAMPEATVRVLEHPGLGTRPWEVRDLAERFAPDESLPQEVVERVEAYEARWAVGRWWERAAAAAWTTWTGWTAQRPWERPGDPLYGPGMYFSYPPNWIAFAAFALAVVLGRKLWSGPGRWRTVGFMGLAVLLLMPVKVPTWAGWVYLPHGYVQAIDFDPFYYGRELAFVLAAALCTAGLAWLLLRLLRRLSGGRGR
ncbi:MAG: hypothetical protein OXH15_03140 [Gammaproteobacteria bacterium]|nr:hypothetical protein [Gammaproteobacteria bacterium]